MNYPFEILPNPYRKLFTCVFQKHKIIRAIKDSTLYDLPTNRDEIRDVKTNLIKEKYICSPSHNLADLSVSLYGVFNASHNEIELHGDGKAIYNLDCSADEKISPPVFEDHFILVPRFYWWMEAEKMHLQTIQLNYNNNQYLVRCHVVHSPMRWNFWHFSFRWEIDGLGYLHQLSDQSVKNKLAKKIGEIGRAQVKMHAQWSELDPFTLNKSCYKKGVLEIIGIWLKTKFSRNN